ncbi:GtrA family protein [Microlunatus elymi]|uniref:GtrA family protein n=1 Tax=Microlunatus elymi TaxID=2596828 RepID=A0A516PYS4_9ACTN|nr:GtrA family protein [Microlunatus elymi]QDP96318.1 GtrA family protein [Microlunatus elymi]
MRRLGHFIFVRHRHNWAQLIRFAIVGGSGALVNMLVVVILKRVGPNYRDVFFDLPFTDFNVRWYHVIVTIAFLVANLWNFVINRRWTFRTTHHSAWYSEYPPFLAVGAIGQVLSLALVTALIHSGSPISLPDSVFDDSTGLRTKLYWAQLISIVVVTPVTFLINKFWTFSAARHGKQSKLMPIDPEMAEAEDNVAALPDRTAATAAAPSSPGTPAATSDSRAAG